MRFSVDHVEIVFICRMKVAKVEGETTCTVKDLIPGSKFEFRVRAETEQGEGDAIEIGPIVADYSFGESSKSFLKLDRFIEIWFCPIDVPSAPNAPTVNNLTSKSLELSWDAPFKDGGSPVTGYHVEQRVGKSSYWRRVTKTATTKTTHHITEVTENEYYEFRIIAENKKAPSLPSEPSERVKIPPTPVVVEKKPPRADSSLRSARASPMPGMYSPSQLNHTDIQSEMFINVCTYNMYIYIFI